MQRWRGQTSRINHTSCRFSVDRNLDPVEAWRLETRKVSPQKSWECHWEFQLVFVGALSGNMVYSAMHVYIYIYLYAENDTMHEAGWNLKLLVSDHWVWSQDCQRSFWVLTRNVEKGASSWSFSVTGVQKHRIFGPSATSGVKGGLGHSRLFIFFWCCKKSIFCRFFLCGSIVDWPI